MEIDLNCDMGEGFGVYTLGRDEELLPYVTSINVACGFHASDPLTMMRIVKRAREFSVALGAHPSYPDLAGFGRREISLSPEEIKASVIYQVGALMGFCMISGIRLSHVKPHGALYNRAAMDMEAARAIAEAVAEIDRSLFLICQAKSKMTVAAREAGIPFVEEFFADRAYRADGLLLPRSLPGAVIHDQKALRERVVRLVRDKFVLSCEGIPVPLEAGTICIHGDTPDAPALAHAVRDALEAEGIDVKPFSAGGPPIPGPH
ncbi:MAG: 5-oxoprolinase subunit PxpA [Candidatus Eremiobacteraeota bacterium]|nr:5-oxoprolinase subunit PxpA [Candidatus Eremiobacteraeota bacterium]